MSLFERFISSLLGSLVGAFSGMMLALHADRAIQRQRTKKLLAKLTAKAREQDEHVWAEARERILNDKQEEEDARPEED